MKTLKQKSLLFFLGLVLAIQAQSQEQEINVVLEGNEVVQVKRSQRTQRTLSKIAKYTTGYIAELQETIGFNERLNKHLGIGIENSRRIFPMGNGDFIVTDETALKVDYQVDAFERLRKEYNLRISFSGSARPSVKRFFISPAAESNLDDEYVEVEGPNGTKAYYGVDDELYDLGGGVRVDAERYARYNEWFSRFTRNITDFPLAIAKADEMVVGEGYSFVFSGGAGVGPSAVFQLIQDGDFVASPHFSLRKLIRTGRFELIVIKTERDKLLFSIRQVRNVGNDDFSVSWGGKVGPNLAGIIGSDKPGFIPSVLNIFKFSRSRTDKTEERYNAVFEVNLNNPADRNIYNEALSKFDFSLFEVFAMKDLAKTSQILQKFRNSSLKLLLDIKTKAEVMIRNSSLQIFLMKKEWLRSRESYVDGEATFRDRKAKVSGGKIVDRRTKSTIFNGKEVRSFEFKAYEEYGDHASRDLNDVVLLARGTLFDSKTQITEVNDEIVDELANYVNFYNHFTRPDSRIEMKSDGITDLATTQALMEFFITRGDVVHLAQRLDEPYLISLVLATMQKRVRVVGADMPQSKINRLSRQDPSQWSFVFRPKIKNAFRDFILGFRDLKRAIVIRDNRQRGLLTSQAVSRMLSFPALAPTYAGFFKKMLERTGRRPKINIEFSNNRLRKQYKDIGYKAGEFQREGLVLTESLDRVTQGLAYYDQINRQYFKRATRSGNTVTIKFKTRSSVYKGFIKVLLKRPTGDDDFSYTNVGEFIIDLQNFNGYEFSFNIGGPSQVEQLMADPYFRDSKIFIALSFDNNAYDEEKLVGNQKDVRRSSGNNLRDHR